MGDAALSFGTKKPSSPSRHVFPKKSGPGSWTTTHFSSFSYRSYKQKMMKRLCESLGEAGPVWDVTG